MGVLNVTPDSFSDGGRWFDTDAAIAHGLALAAEGADLVDVGGESTRPGAERPDLGEELRRVVPVVEALTAAGVVVSTDTMRAEVAAAAVGAGARLVNDVSGGLADPEMLACVAGLDTAYVCMHWRGHATVMQDRTAYADVVDDVVAELGARLDAARAAGIADDRLVVDVGYGFAKTAEHNWQLLRRPDALAGLGVPQLVGVSRKAFLGALLPDADGRPRPAAGREDATTALTTLLALQGVWGVRVHAVRAGRDAVAVVGRLGGRWSA
ncbi:dihydropteroate synthase [Friedmanniella luteola]|nr:dihydropteroate synthase [Friedmanniella luteola]